MNIMKWLRLVIVGGLVFGLNLWAADSATAGREKDHDALQALQAMLVKAMDAKDTSAIANCFTKDFVFTTANQTVITNKTELDALFTRMFTGKDAPLKTMTTKPEATIQTRFTDANSGYCYGTTKDTYVLKNGYTVVIPAKWTAVVVKQDGEWKVAAAHIGVNFLDNPVLHGQHLSIWRKAGIFFFGASEK